jgi:hypothetical protein
MSLIATLVLAALAFGVPFKLLKALGMGCAHTLCHAGGYAYGAQLFMACLVLVLVGMVFGRVVARGTAAPRAPTVFGSLVTGLVLLMTYVYLRSAGNQHLVDLPVTVWELLGLLVAGLIAVWRVRPQALQGLRDSVSLKAAALDLLLLFALCVIVASRELPRDIMLSSDPDVHTFFGRQVERFGAVPYHQRDWGGQGFNYPAGSGVVLFIWHLFSGIDHRGLLAALPVLFTFVAAMVVVDAVDRPLARPAARLVVQWSALALVAAGLTFPYYNHYAHLEGAARQMSVLFSALFLGLFLAQARQSAYGETRSLALMSMTVFCLLAMNPANVVLPGVLVAALVLYRLLSGQRAWPLSLAMAAGMALMALEPYYHGLVGIARQARVDTVVYAQSLVIKTWPEVLEGTWTSWFEGYTLILPEFVVLFAERGIPVFAGILVLYVAVLLLLGQRPRLNARQLAAVAFFLVLFYLVYGFARSLLDDRRFFLLGPYVFFNMSQYKALSLVVMLTLVLRKAMSLPFGPLLVVPLAVALVWPVKHLVRSEQQMYLSPRRDYCGVYGCLLAPDRVLLEKFQAMHRSGAFSAADGSVSRVLIPNSIKRTEHETWILPVKAGRVLPHYEVMPAAFFYYQGDVEYATHFYLQHVCDRFDREWLKSKGIRYVFLPSERSEACMEGMEALPQSETVLLQEGNAYLLKLR